jgi:hypothetical protein
MAGIIKWPILRLTEIDDYIISTDGKYMAIIPFFAIISITRIANLKVFPEFPAFIKSPLGNDNYKD